MQINEIFEEIVSLAVESEMASSEESFVRFLHDYLPPEILDRIESEIGASLGDIWKDRYEIIPVVQQELRIDNDDGSCEMCERYVSRTLHHLIPRELHKTLVHRISKEELSKTVKICRMCHSSIHRFFTNEELANHYNTIEKLLGDEKMYKYASWAAKQPAGGNRKVR